MPKLTIERPETVQMRVEPDLHEALRQMAAGNAMSKSEMARALLRRGMRAVAEEDNTAGRYGPPVELDREVVSHRVGYLIELLDHLADSLGRTDPEGAETLMRGVEQVCGQTARQWQLANKRVQV